MAIKNTQLSIFILAVLHVVGWLGIYCAWHPDFVLLTPVNLLVCLAIVLLHHPNWSVATLLTLVFVAVGGWALEVYGVTTGALFGDYHYGRTLGWQYQSVPMAMAINWVSTIYCTGVLVNHGFERWHIVLKSVIGAAATVSLDVLIEPIAMRYDFWQWKNNFVPGQNYYAWGIISFGFLLIFNLFQGKIKNKVAVALLILQFLFFAALIW